MENPRIYCCYMMCVCVCCVRLDHKSCAETGQELMRPYLHEFLTSAYGDYDIVIWCMFLKMANLHIYFTKMYALLFD